MLQHRLASKEALDGNTQALDRGHGEGTNNGADGEVDENVALAIAGCEVEDQEEADSQEDRSISKETWKRERNDSKLRMDGGQSSTHCPAPKETTQLPEYLALSI